MKPNVKMSMLMGVTLSFFLSLTGLLSAGRLTLLAFMANFTISFAISLIIGRLVSVKKVSDSLGQKLNIPPRTLKARLFDALVSDVIYTPIMTFCMVSIAYFQATKQGAHIFFPAMYGRALLISLAVGYLLIFIFMPLFAQMSFKDKE